MKKVLSIMIAACVLLASFPMVSLAADVSVDNFADLKTALQADGTSVIEITGDIVFTGGISFSGASRVKTLISDGSYTFTRADSMSEAMLTVLNGATLNIGGVAGYDTDLVFDGTFYKESELNKTTDCHSLVLANGNGTVANIYSGTYKNNISGGYEGTVSSKGGASVYLYGGLITANGKAGEWDRGAGVVVYDSNSVLTVDGANIIGNKSNEKGASANVGGNGAHLIINSGLISANEGMTNIHVGNDGRFTMNGGTVENYNDTVTLNSEPTMIYFEERIVANINGGIIRNCSKTGIQATGAGTVVNMGTYNGNNGVLIENIGYNKSGVGQQLDGGAFNVEKITLNINAGTYRHCYAGYGGGLAQVRNETTVVNLFGGRVENCGEQAVDMRGGIINIGGSPSFDVNSTITLKNGILLNIVSDINLVGAVAMIGRLDDGKDLIRGITADTPELLEANAPKFVAQLWSWTLGGKTGYNAGGYVDYSVAPLDFVWPQPAEEPEDELELDYTAKTVTVKANYDIAEAVIIVASYDDDKKLVDVETFDISVAADVDFVQPVSGGFDEGAKVKVMLWDSLDTIKPLIENL